VDEKFCVRYKNPKNLERKGVANAATACPRPTASSCPPRPSRRAVPHAPSATSHAVSHARAQK
jgi:hypothetical protein